MRSSTEQVIVNRLIVIVFFLFFLIFQSYGQVKKIQSGIIYYFTQYIEWPANKKDGDFIIAVFGNDEISQHLEEMAKVRKVGSRNIQIKTVTNTEQAKDAHILYLPKSMEAIINPTLLFTKKENILLVSEGEGTAKDGACIGFVLKGGKPSFEINTETLTASNLKISQKLTALGTVVK